MVYAVILPFIKRETEAQNVPEYTCMLIPLENANAEGCLCGSVGWVSDS